jgi:hypothetical protein
MLNHISNTTARACLEALAQLHRENDKDAILSLADAIDDAVDNPLGEMMLAMLAQVGKVPAQWAKG